jgi:glycosyltransferase involved in cell wall biosynthesis
VDPGDRAGLARALAEMCDGPARRAAARAAGLARAGRWSWDDAAAATLGVYETAGRRR